MASRLTTMSLAALERRREDVRVGRVELTRTQQLALLDVLIEGKRALARAEAHAAKAVAMDLFPSPQPVRLPGDAHG